MANDSSAVERCPRIENSDNAGITVASGQAVSVRVRAVNLQVKPPITGSPGNPD